MIQMTKRGNKFLAFTYGADHQRNYHGEMRGLPPSCPALQR